MRRRLRSAAVPVHPHALPQIVLDAVLVAFAYYVAYPLRFDAGVPERYQELREHSLSIAVVVSLVVFSAFGLYRHWWRYASQRDYLRVIQATLVSTLAVVGCIAVLDPAYVNTDTGYEGLSAPTGVVALFFLLTLLLLLGARALVRVFYDRPVGSFRPNRNARSVLIVGAG